MRFATAQKQGIAYLQSDEFKTREDANTTIASIPTLIEINKLGYITDSSQEGLIEKGYNPDSKRYYRIEERAYITGIMKKKEAYQFVQRMNEITDKIAVIIRSDGSKEYKKLWESGDPVPTLTVTVSGSSEVSQSAIKHLDGATKLPIALPPNSFWEPYKSISEEVEEVAVIDPVYGRKASSAKGLYKAVISVLKELNSK